jgi:hypothetical protein
LVATVNTDNQLMPAAGPRAGYAFAVRGVGVQGLDVVATTLTALSASAALSEAEARYVIIAHAVRCWVITRL